LVIVARLVPSAELPPFTQRYIVAPVTVEPEGIPPVLKAMIPRRCAELRVTGDAVVPMVPARRSALLLSVKAGE
jgi:hypothetical protein